MRDLAVRLGDRLEALTNLGKKGKKAIDKIAEERCLLARCLHSLGDYSRTEDLSALSEAQICYERSTELWPNLKGFRKLANVNLAIIERLELAQSHPPMETIIPIAVAVIESERAEA